MEKDTSHFGATAMQEDCQSLRKPSLQSHPLQQRLQLRWQLRFTASLRRTRTALSSMCFCGGTSRRWLTPLRILLHGGCFSLAMDVLLSRGTWPCLSSSKTVPSSGLLSGCLCQRRLCCYLWASVHRRCFSEARKGFGERSSTQHRASVHFRLHPFFRVRGQDGVRPLSGTISKALSARGISFRSVVSLGSSTVVSVLRPSLRVLPPASGTCVFLAQRWMVKSPFSCHLQSHLSACQRSTFLLYVCDAVDSAGSCRAASSPFPSLPPPRGVIPFVRDKVAYATSTRAASGPWRWIRWEWSLVVPSPSRGSGCGGTRRLSFRRTSSAATI